MPRYPKAPTKKGLALEVITIKMTRGARLPVVELSGRTYTGNPRLDAVTQFTVRTVAIPPSGQQFIKEMVEAYDGLFLLEGGT